MNHLIYPVLQFITLTVFVGLVVLLFLTPVATSLTWTLIIPFVPAILLVIGYSRWRRICPLAWFSKLTQNLAWTHKFVLPKWFENNFYILQFSILLIAFELRLLVLNSDALLLGSFFALVIVMALLSGLLLSGKSWCNYLCPVGVVEKIYVGSNSHMYHLNSKCESCTACKKNCPDIDAESAYWKEVESPQKRIVFFAFPGLVFGFYLYYFLEAGNWDYYFNGAWTVGNESLTILSSLTQPGFYFMPEIPKVMAAFVTLAGCSLVSYLLFTAAEKAIHGLTRQWEKDQKTVLHITQIIAAFSAFNIFYFFAGAPTFSKYPLFYALFHFLVIVVSAWILWKEFYREERFFIQERFARRILKKSSPDEEITNKNLKEVYYTYATQQKSHDQHLQDYKETVFDLISDGIMSQEDTRMLDRIRNQLQITQHEHNKIMQALQKEHPEYFMEDDAPTAEKLFQFKSYKNALQKALDEDDFNDQKLDALRKHFQITPEEHAKISQELMHTDTILQDKLEKELSELVELYRINAMVPRDMDIETKYLKYSITSLINVHLRHMQQIMPLFCTDDAIKTMMELVQSDEMPQEKIETLPQNFQTLIMELGTLKKKEPPYGAIWLNDAATHIFKLDVYELIPALMLVIASQNMGAEFKEAISKYTASTDPLLEEVSMIAFEGKNVTSVIKKAALLHAVPIFMTLPTENIEMLAQKAVVKDFSDGDHIVKQGDMGDALYILAEGNADVIVDGEKVAKVSQYDYIGEIAIFSGESRTASVQATGDVKALELSVETLKEVIQSRPEISFDMMRQMTLRLLEQKKSS